MITLNHRNSVRALQQELASCEKSRLRNDACLVSLGISGKHGNCTVVGTIKSSTTARMSVPQTFVALCQQNPELR